MQEDQMLVSLGSSNRVAESSSNRGWRWSAATISARLVSWIHCHATLAITLMPESIEGGGMAAQACEGRCNIQTRSGVQGAIVASAFDTGTKNPSSRSNPRNTATSVSCPPCCPHRLHWACSQRSVAESWGECNLPRFPAKALCPILSSPMPREA